LKTIILKILKWLNDFRNEIKEINNSNRYNNFKTDTKILKEEQEHLKKEFDLYMDKMKIKHTKNLKKTLGLSVLINLLILISATFTILGFNLHDMAFQITTDISKGVIGISLIIGFILIQCLCFHAESIQTTIEQYFGRHIKGLNRIKYILIPISIIGTFNFLIDYITFTDYKVLNDLMVFMICVSIDYSILVFSGIRYDKKHLIFSKNSNNIVKDNKSILHMILFNLLGDKLLKIRLDYMNKVSTYNQKLLQNTEQGTVHNDKSSTEQGIVHNDKSSTEQGIVHNDKQSTEQGIVHNDDKSSTEQLINKIDDFISNNYEVDSIIKTGEIRKNFNLEGTNNKRKWDKVRNQLKTASMVNGKLRRQSINKFKVVK